MSKITEKIFKGVKHYITSNYGYREYYYQGELQKDFHNGSDYGTDGLMINQYAIEDGKVISCGTDSSGGKFAWINYPRLNVNMLHYHLNEVKVKNGQNVNKDTLVGTTGMTGKATGIHLHLGILDLSSNKYLNPEVYASTYTEPEEKELKTIDEIANDVIKGLYGNYPERKTLLEESGYNYSEVQAKVNELCNEKQYNKVHLVVKGDTLCGIAKKYYNDGSKYPVIADFNNIDNPDLIYVGQRIKIPNIK